HFADSPVEGGGFELSVPGDSQSRPSVTVAQRHGLGDQSIQDHPRPKLSRRVVRTVIRSEATEFHYERRQQPLPRIDPWPTSSTVCCSRTRDRPDYLRKQ